jgi:hypothetical protein
MDNDDMWLEDEQTIPSRLTVTRPADAISLELGRSPVAPRVPVEVPWLLQQHYNGKIDLAAELAQRYPTPALLTVAKFRKRGAANDPAQATFSAADGMAALSIEALPNTPHISFGFTFQSSFTLRFQPDTLSDVDCAHWLELIRRNQDGIAFLWGQSRWETDYLVCVMHRQFVSLYAYSTKGFESSIRLTHEVKHQLHDWLIQLWNIGTSAPPPPLSSSW